MNKCILPFIRYDYKDKSPCCIISKNYQHERDYQKLLDDHRTGLKSNFCNRCWKTEDVGKKSKRQESNEFFKKYIKQEDVKIISLVIPTGNVCNLSCVTCGPYASSGWKSKYDFMKSKDNIFKNNYYNLIPTELKEKIKWNEIKDVEFLGGETLMSKNIWQFLDLFNKETTISLLTNGTVKLRDWQIEKLKEKENLHICFSIDGFDKIFEFLRQPAKWEDVYQNILEYKRYFGINRLSYNITVGNINIFYIDEILKKLIKILPVKSSINFIEYPMEFSVSNLTGEQGKIIESRNPYFFLKEKKENIKWLGNNDSIIKFIRNIKLQEEFSKIFIKDYLPEYYEFIKEQYLRH